MSRKTVIGVMGGGEARPRDREQAYRLGGLIARQGWVLLNGGRNAGIMAATAKGAADQGGLTIGILPDEDDRRISAHIAIGIFTGMGSARNVINVLSSQVVVACPGGAGTLSEVALALKYGRPVVLMNYRPGPEFGSYRQKGQLRDAATPEETIEIIKTWVYPPDHDDPPE